MGYHFADLKIAVEQQKAAVDKELEEMKRQLAEKLALLDAKLRELSGLGQKSKLSDLGQNIELGRHNIDKSEFKISAEGPLGLGGGNTSHRVDIHGNGGDREIHHHYHGNEQPRLPHLSMQLLDRRVKESSVTGLSRLDAL